MVSLADVTATPIDSESEWDTVAAPCPGFGPFHTWAWAQVIEQTYGHRSSFVRLEADGAAAAFLPLVEVRSRLTGVRAVTAPFSDRCPPLFPRGAGGGHDARRARYHGCLQRLAGGRGWAYVELRGEGVEPAGAVPTASFLGHTLDLGRPVEAVEGAYDPAVRRAVRKAERSGVQVEIGSTAASMDAYRALHSVTRRRHGLPPQPRKFFDVIYRLFLDRGDGWVVTARHAGRPIASAVFLRAGAGAVYKFGASDERSWQLRPNHAVMAAAVRHLIGAGVRTLEFGRTDIGHEGLARFKRSWGASQAGFHYFRITPQGSPAGTPPRPPVAGWHNAFFRHAPAPLCSAAGAALYPHLD